MGTVSIVTRASLIAADGIVIAVTWFRLRGHVKDALSSTFAATISAAMLVDGKMSLDSTMTSQADFGSSGSIYFVWVPAIFRALIHRLPT